MKRNYGKVSQFLSDTFPELDGHITGGNYPPPAYAIIILNLLSVVQLLFMAIMVMGESFFRLFPIRLLFGNMVPNWYYSCKQYGLQIGMLLFLILPQVFNSFVITGAFEITLDGKTLIYSKLKTGKLPHMNDLVAPLKDAGLALKEVVTPQQTA